MIVHATQRSASSLSRSSAFPCTNENGTLAAARRAKPWPFRPPEPSDRTENAFPKAAGVECCKRDRGKRRRLRCSCATGYAVAAAIWLLGRACVSCEQPHPPPVQAGQCRLPISAVRAGLPQAAWTSSTGRRNPPFPVPVQAVALGPAGGESVSIEVEHRRGGLFMAPIQYPQDTPQVLHHCLEHARRQTISPRSVVCRLTPSQSMRPSCWRACWRDGG